MSFRLGFGFAVPFEHRTNRIDDADGQKECATEEEKKRARPLTPNGCVAQDQGAADRQSSHEGVEEDPGPDRFAGSAPALLHNCYLNVGPGVE